MTKCFVGGVGHDTTEAVMKGFFSQFGEVEEAVIVVDRNTRRPKGFGFVTFKDDESATKACASPDLALDGRTLTVKPATKKGTRQPSLNSKKVFLGGLTENLTQADLTASLSKFGELETVVMQRPASEGTKGYAFATFASIGIANKALEEGHVDCKGTKVSVLNATPRGQSRQEPRGEMRGRPVPGGYQGPMYPMMHHGHPGAYAYPPQMGGYGGQQQYMSPAPFAKRQKTFGKVVDRVDTSKDELIPSKVFVGGISRDSSEEAVTTFFAKFGEIEEVIIVKNRETRKPKGFGFIIYKDAEGAKKACAATDLTLDGRCLSVRPATKKGTKRIVTTSRQVFVGGLTVGLSEAQVQMALSVFGTVESVVLQSPATDSRKGYGFASFCSVEIANKAIEEGHCDCNGTRLTVLVSSSHSDPSQRGTQGYEAGICNDFQNGRCHRGNSCRYTHVHGNPGPGHFAAPGPPPAQGYYGGYAGQPGPPAGYGGMPAQQSPAGHYGAPSAAANMYAPPAPAASQYMQVVSITVPAGCVPGQGIPVMSLTGEQMTVAIPPGVGPGQSFQMKMPAPAPAPAAPAAPEYTQVVSITVPAGCVPGQGIPIMTPSGEQMTVAIPAGVGPGQSFQMKIPAPAPAKLAPVMARAVPGGYGQMQ